LQTFGLIAMQTESPPTLFFAQVRAERKLEMPMGI
jgi:hypothetical protein